MSLLGGHGVRAIEQCAHRRPTTTVPYPGAEERLFRDDLSRVRDEPEQGLGLWIGMTVKTGAGNSLDDTGRVPSGPGNSPGEAGNTPADVGNVPRGISHSRGA